MRSRLTSAALGLALLAACRPLTAPTQHLRLDVEVDRTDLPVGSPVTIRVSLSNAAVAGARTVVFHGSSTCTFGFQVRDVRGRVVAPAQRACTRDLQRWYLEPGHRLDRTFRWDGTVSEGSAQSVAPGRYSLVGVLESQEVRLESPPVEIQLRPAPQRT